MAFCIVVALLAFGGLWWLCGVSSVAFGGVWLLVVPSLDFGGCWLQLVAVVSIVVLAQ